MQTPFMKPFWLAFASVVAVVGAMISHARSGEPKATASAHLASAIAVAQSGGNASLADGIVEAVRQSVVAAQVPGIIVSLSVKPGDRVAVGQVLALIDARAAQQTTQASKAQVQAAQASLVVAERTLTRQRSLKEKGFISAAALDQAEAEFKAAQAAVNAQKAQAAVSDTQTDFHIIRAPYSGIVSDVPVAEGDMAMPGRPLLTLYDPNTMRVTATAAQADVSSKADAREYRVELLGAFAERAEPVAPIRVTVLPAADPNTQTVRVRLDLPKLEPTPVPGSFARVRLPALLAASATPPGARVTNFETIRILVPSQAIVRRGELKGVYVLTQEGARLRQVRAGSTTGTLVEILSGLEAGERVALDPQAAARSPSK
jgi:RND family efflux transporter MFP subunit